MRNAIYIPYEQISHKVWQDEDLCVSSGKVGFCHNGKCDLEASKVITRKLNQMAQPLLTKYSQGNYIEQKGIHMSYKYEEGASSMSERYNNATTLLISDLEGNEQEIYVSGCEFKINYPFVIFLIILIIL